MVTDTTKNVHNTRAHAVRAHTQHTHPRAYTKTHTRHISKSNKCVNRIKMNAETKNTKDCKFNDDLPTQKDLFTFLGSKEISFYYLDENSNYDFIAFKKKHKETDALNETATLVTRNDVYGKVYFFKFKDMTEKFYKIIPSYNVYFDHLESGKLQEKVSCTAKAEDYVAYINMKSGKKYELLDKGSCIGVIRRNFQGNVVDIHSAIKDGFIYKVAKKGRTFSMARSSRVYRKLETTNGSHNLKQSKYDVRGNLDNFRLCLNETGGLKKKEKSQNYISVKPKTVESFWKLIKFSENRGKEDVLFKDINGLYSMPFLKQELHFVKQHCNGNTEIQQGSQFYFQGKFWWIYRISEDEYDGRFFKSK